MVTLAFAVQPSTAFSQENGADEPSLEDLQRQIDELRGQPRQQDGASLADLQRQIDELKTDGQSFVRARNEETEFRIVGRIQIDAWTFPSTDDGINVIETGDPTQEPANNFEFRRARLGVIGAFWDNMNYMAEIDFSKPDELAFTDLFLGFENVPGGQRVQIGNQKRPYGLETINSSNNNVFMERSFAVEAFNGSNRRPGVVAYGVTEEERWNWRYGAFLMNDMARTGEVVANNVQPELAARIANTLWWKDEGSDFAHAALSGSYAWPDGDADTSDGDASNQSRFDTRPEARSQEPWLDTGTITGAHHQGILGLEGLLNLGPTQITAEIEGARVARSGARDAAFWGGYVYVSYFITGEHMAWNRELGQLDQIQVHEPLGKGPGAWQVAARYSYADYSDEDVLGGEGQNLTFGLNWWWNGNAGLQFNYIHGRIDDRETEVGATPVVVDGGYDILGIRLRIFF
jgi:phosphate-selective porin OprO/OprP